MNKLQIAYIASKIDQAKEGQMKHINFVNHSVRNYTFDGVLISRIAHVNSTCCDFGENGSNVAPVVPGPKIQHNLLLTHRENINIKGSPLDTSHFGSGIALDHCRDDTITNCKVMRKAYYGILISESKILRYRVI